MAQAYLATRISPHIARTPEGFLIATAPIARSGWQEYRRSEIDRATNDPTIVRVFRPVSEVTSQATIASGEGKPIVSPHPPMFVSPDNWGWTAKGHVQNVRVGGRDRDGNVLLVGDLHIHDASLISKIAAGTRDLSCGYTYDLDTLSDGSLAMRNIRLNHVAVVEQGRAGTTQIMDSKGTEMTDEERDELLGRIASGIEALLALRNENKTEREPENSELEFEQESDSPDVRALVGLRALRPTIGESGDHNAIDAYNKAVRAVKARIRTHAIVVDNALRRSLGTEEAENLDFFAAAQQFHRQNPKKVRLDSDATTRMSRSGRTHDSSPSNQDWFEEHRDVGRKMRAKKW